MITTTRFARFSAVTTVPEMFKAIAPVCRPPDRPPSSLPPAHGDSRKPRLNQETFLTSSRGAISRLVILYMQQTLLLALASLALMGHCPAQALFIISNITDSSSPTFSSFTAPSLNSVGAVAFQASLDAGGSGIFRGTTGGTTTIASTSGGSFSGFSTYAPAINTAGTVAFQASLTDGDTGVFTGSGGATTTIAHNYSSSFWTFGQAPSINSAGIVAFQASQDAGWTGVFTGDGVNPTTTIATSFSPVFMSFGGAPSINAGGAVAFFANRDAGGVGIYTGDGGATTTIVTAEAGSSPYTDLSFQPSLNDSGTAAVRANLYGGGTGIVTGDGVTTTEVALSTGPDFAGLSEPASINASGTVLFAGGLDAGGFGLFTGSDPVADLVIHSGDVLFGSTLDGLQLSTRSLNDSGQIAFQYTLLDGRTGIALATPVLAPEPGSAALVALGTLALGLRRRLPAGVRPKSNRER
ncbi:MAG: PEP-CTERM sorting domain-containing protein [Verrucomicrobia bacterium]|nr:PEP-CTERM sorting domain-containing protein [Verrucomicrobiota bacterium]